MMATWPFWPRQEVEACQHTGRLKPIVWLVMPKGDVPDRVMCEDCSGVIDADEPAASAYVEDADGWYRPVEAERRYDDSIEHAAGG